MLKLNTILFLISLSVLAISHLLALEFYLYWRYIWLDVPMHILGGSVVAIGVFACAELRLPLASYVSASFVKVMSFVVVIMIGWEVFEVWAGIPIQENYVFDTSIDLTVGFIGGVIGFYLAKRVSRL